MPKTLLTSSQSAQGGTIVRSTLQDSDFSPPIAYGINAFQNEGFYQGMAIWSPTSSHSNQKIEVINPDASSVHGIRFHWIQFLASMNRDTGNINQRASTVNYTVHPSQQLVELINANGARFRVGLQEPYPGGGTVGIDLNAPGSPAYFAALTALKNFGENDPGVIEYEFGWESARGGFIDIYYFGQLVHSYEQPGPILAGTVIRIESTSTSWSVWKDGVALYQQAHASQTIFPLNLRYRYRCMPGLAVINTPFIFNEAVLSGAWVPRTDIIWGDAFAGETFVTAEAYSAGGVVLDIPAWLSANAAIAQGIDGAGHPYFDVVMPSAGNYTPQGGGAPLALSYIKTLAKWNRPAWPSAVDPDYQTPGWVESGQIASVGGTPSPPLTLDTHLIQVRPSFDGANFSGYQFRITSPNYPASELTFTPVGGGSMGVAGDKNLYTAPVDAGVYSVNVTRAGETAVLQVHVLVHLAPDTKAFTGGSSQVYKINADVVNFATTGWQLDGGTFSEATKAVRSVTYFAPTAEGDYRVKAQVNVPGILVGLVESRVSVLASGPAPVAGLRLSPAEGISQGVNSSAAVILEADSSPALWAYVSNFEIDGSNNNLKIVNNRAGADAILLQGVGWDVFNLKWKFNSTNLATSVDKPFYYWAVTDAAGGIVARITLEYLQTGNSWRVMVHVSGDQVASEDFTASATTEIEIDFTTPLSAVFRYRPNSGAGWTTLHTAPSLQSSPRFFNFHYTPTINSQADRTVIVALPTITSVKPRIYPPTFHVEMLDAGGAVIGTLPFTATERTLINPGPWVCTVQLQTVGRGRVRADYFSGVTAVNTVALTITEAGGEAPLVVLTPATSVVEIAPGGTINVTTNYEAGQFSVFAAPGQGFFGPEFANRYRYTAPTKSGFYQFQVTRNATTITIHVKVLPVITPTSITVPAGQSASLSVNYDGNDQTIGATGGTVSFGAKANGATAINFIAGPTAGASFKISYTNPIKNIEVPVTVTVVGTDPIVIQTPSDPLTLEPGASQQIVTNYGASEVTFALLVYNTNIAIAGGFIGDRVQAPAGAGWYTIKVSKFGAGEDTMTLRVPIRLTPKNPAPIQPPGQIQFNANYAPVTWSTPASQAGSINPSTGLFSTGAQPDTITVTVTGVIQGTTYQDTATVTVLGATLRLTNPATGQVAPGGTVTIIPEFPYTPGQLTYSAAGGAGSFAANVWTAPTDAGTYFLTATHVATNQSVTIQVTVPLVITPASWSMQTGTTKLFEVNKDVISWLGTGLTLTLPTVRTITASPPVAGNYVLTATTALGQVHATIVATGSADIPLVITNADPSEVESDATITIQTNPPHPVSELTYSANGGTFTGNVWRAPNVAGSYTLTVTKGAQSDSITVNVPVRIKPASVVLSPGGTIQFTVNHHTASWNQQAPSGGSITPTGFYTALGTPGDFPNSVRVSTPAGGAFASVTIQQTDLVVFGPTSITLQPGATYEVQSNPFGRSVQYTAFGGSFSGAGGNIYTAPPNAGNYHFIVSFGSQSVRIDVHVPLVITPAEVNLELGATFQFTANAPGAAWSVSSTTGQPGQITSSGFYTAPTSGGTVAIVTASLAGDSATAIVLFLTVLPYNPTYAVEGETLARAVVVYTEAGDLKGRLKGPIKKTYQLHFDYRDKAELLAVLAFHSSRFPEIPILFHDHNLDIFVACYFDSQVKWQVTGGGCAFSYSFRLKEA